METWIALLRGINVGGHHIVPMKALRGHMEADGFCNVRTYIQSGNVVFNTPEPPHGRLPALVEAHFGFRPWVLLLEHAELEAASKHNPFPSDAGKAVHFFFLDRIPEKPDFELLESLCADSESVALEGRVCYVYAPEGIGRSKLVAGLGKAFPGTTMTGRNLNTIRKLLEMAGQ